MKASRVLHAPIALITLVDAERQFFKSAVGLPEPWAAQRETPLLHCFCQHVVASSQPLIIADTRERPLKDLFASLALKLKILTPFVGMTKGEVIRLGAKLPLRYTVTCARPKGIVHCGRCTKCAERVAGFRAAGIPDPTAYARRPPQRA